jgi:transcriptional regulator with XRE-family HTH domain
MARHEAGLTLEELSESSGVSVRALSDMERGRALGPQRRTVVLLADALKLEGARRYELVDMAKSGRTRSAYLGPRPVSVSCPGRSGISLAGRGAGLDLASGRRAARAHRPVARRGDLRRRRSGQDDPGRTNVTMVGERAHAVAIHAASDKGTWTGAPTTPT